MPRNVPIFNANVEAHAMQALNGLMVLFQTVQRPIGPEALRELQDRITQLVDCTFPVNGTSADFTSANALPAGQYVHPIKVAEVVALFGRPLDLKRSRVIALCMGAALMNVGYLLLKQLLIDEPRRLAQGEWEEQVKMHPALSVSALSSAGLPHETIVAIGQHHERWDGSGYPHGARGEEIALEARILAIADTFVSLRSYRPYRPAVPMRAALKIIESHAGELFEPELVQQFCDTMLMYEEKENAAAAPVRSGPAAAAAQAGAAIGRSALEREHDEYAAPARQDAHDSIDERIERARIAALSHFKPAPERVSSSRGGVQRMVGRTALPQPQRRRPRAAARRASGAPPPPRRLRRSLFSADVYLDTRGG